MELTQFLAEPQYDLMILATALVMISALFGKTVQHSAKRRASHLSSVAFPGQELPRKSSGSMRVSSGSSNGSQGVEVPRAGGVERSDIPLSYKHENGEFNSQHGLPFRAVEASS
mmetsp:Transcript_13623/g.21270  ORF Transcript_13623/g.21270 Transcript_13623/m.21270 type:complete len:114 (+) Transcript_13623:421-762(+)